MASIVNNFEMGCVDGMILTWEKVKGKVSPVHVLKPYRSGRGITPFILNLV